ncbi:hypothetical protein Belba_0455 [Belliella baltica DSM 15883]|uniref:Uncharacterized protein n=1 Tax=Belliella baltica (strain DSM 15883 / CIP 108006 / LMG 21964 / BA134) TaxID=866536 RepID=I3Z1J6_BELBD|nr:hypothetical protein [Belliella baltica]AFL83114.1 hypothetical protein Belba_0455 [Belliella baltica DSM 15883]
MKYFMIFTNYFKLLLLFLFITSCSNNEGLLNNRVKNLINTLDLDSSKPILILGFDKCPVCKSNAQSGSSILENLDISVVVVSRSKKDILSLGEIKNLYVDKDYHSVSQNLYHSLPTLYYQKKDTNYDSLTINDFEYLKVFEK